ncbi:hypothetical protein UY416_02755 [Paenibacillus polymyxa]|uniref:hypothetical protein n=1 Tax=Paenibacillus polymyxa TaxID=1406 RepID=UPI002AB4BA36|nr:hypothetical protein [Paenibacillus polymyxa]MDY8045211.1 hypothetical protein [Paenibacillus polymyxa]
MSVQILDDGFGNKFFGLLDECADKILIISPFIGRSTAASLADLLEKSLGINCIIIIRFFREDFINGASSLHGLE